MQIDIHQEQLLSMAQAARLLPGKPAPSTLWRWHTKGIQGVRLETVVIGGRRYTSREALQRFADAVTAAADTADRRESEEAPGRSESTKRRLEESGLL